MVGLGLGDYLVGISDATFEKQWLELMYPAAKDIPMYSDEVSAEALQAVNPDIVFCSDPEQAEDFRAKALRLSHSCSLPSMISSLLVSVSTSGRFVPVSGRFVCAESRLK